ncbi:EAL domain-containing protein [Caulobacter sp. LjRoot300]|uniref:EAL domain-containing protein n=1 Tax=Caulobacter sp. LjRoot300 TaxID=3342321 RepID=UPI003ECFAE35
MSRLPNTGNRRILVIDDTPSIHQDFQKILGSGLDSEAALASSEAALFGDAPTVRQAFELDSAYQGQEALAMVIGALAENRPYAMAFIDMRMPPGWDGVETIERLWQVDPQLQIALCTAYSDYSWEAMSERLELGDRLLILKKPFDNVEIRQMASALTAKWQMTQDAASKMSRLEQAVEERTKALAEQNARFDAAFSNMPHGLCMFDADRRLILCNAAYARLYKLVDSLSRPGTPLSSILDYRASVGNGPESFAAYYAATVEAELTEAAASSEAKLADGRTIRITHNPIPTGGYVATHEDVSEAIRATARIEFLAFRDPLTALPNRAAFQRAYDDAVAEAVETGEMFGLIMVDVDHFKEVNDTLGHDAGDALLQALAVQLKKAFRREDTVARLGGDEFAVLLRGLSRQGDMDRPIAVLQRLLRKPVEHFGQSFTIRASLGAALHVDSDADPAELMKNADVALYQAKSGGRNRAVIFEPSMRAEVEKRVELLREVRQAIARDEFKMFYQPVIDLASNSVAGFEALMRWNHPERGILPPAAFMAALDDDDLSLQLGEMAFEQCLGQMRAWLDGGVKFGRVAINVSSSQFHTGRLALDIEAKLRRWNLSPEHLTIEVTENVYMGWGGDVVSQAVRRLHDAGVLIALDDFGTGYASLANLRQFPIDRLKIDKSFVQNSEDDAIVRAVIGLGASMGMKVVAEGVECADQLATLTSYGCDQVQGYHFAKPMPATEVAGFIRNFAREADVLDMTERRAASAI